MIAIACPISCWAIPLRCICPDEQTFFGWSCGLILVVVPRAVRGFVPEARLVLELVLRRHLVHHLVPLDLYAVQGRDNRCQAQWSVLRRVLRCLTLPRKIWNKLESGSLQLLRYSPMPFETPEAALGQHGDAST